MCIVSDVFLFFKQKTAYEMRISDWSSDVCSSDLQASVERQLAAGHICTFVACEIKAQSGHFLYCAEALQRRVRDESRHAVVAVGAIAQQRLPHRGEEIGRASCRERVCQYV